jgi:IMP dehydrogenase
VSLVEGKSIVDSRSDVDISVDLTEKYDLHLPIFTASMDTITSKDMAEVMLNEGGAVVHHRFCSPEQRVENIAHGRRVRRHMKGINGVAVGYEDSIKDVQRMVREGAELISLDLAHAWHDRTIEWLRERRAVLEDVLVVVGSFSHPEGIRWLHHQETCSYEEPVVDMIRVSQGGGSACTTRQKAGVGKPTLQAVIDYNTNTSLPYDVIADGGVRYPGDVAKSIGAGACGAMIGGMLSGSEECPGQVVNIEGDHYKEFRGMASQSAKEDGEEVDAAFIEGVSTKVPVKGSAHNILDNIKHGLKSSIATCGFDCVEDFQREAEFIRLSHSSQIESSPHSLHRYGKSNTDG